MEESKRQGVKVSFTFSDQFLVNLFADDFKQVTKDYCDVIFCNAEEILSFYGSESLDDCVKKIGEIVDTAFVTNGKEGCLVVKNKEIVSVAGFPVKAIDTVGAGDAFAGGVLYGLTHGYSETDAAKWGNYLASNIVTIQGARLEGIWSDKIEGVLKA